MTNEKGFEEGIELGMDVVDTVSGYTGVTTARVEYLNGCVQYCVIAKVRKDGKYIEGVYFDEARLDPVKSTKKKLVGKIPGGHQRKSMRRSGGGDSFSEVGRDTLEAPTPTYRG